MSIPGKRKRTFDENMQLLPNAFESGWKSVLEGTEKQLIAAAKGKCALVGSGASRAMATLAARSIERYLRGNASVLLPQSLELYYEDFDALILFSARGNNVDAQAAAEISIAAKHEPLLVFTQSANSKVLARARDYPYSSFVIGTFGDQQNALSEGFLGVLTMVEALGAFTRTLALATDAPWDELPSLVETWADNSRKWLARSTSQINELVRRPHTVALGGYWSEDVIADLESKWVEGALGWIEVSDVRNFSHGRYINSFSRTQDTAIVLLTTPDDESVRKAFLESMEESGIEIIDVRAQHSGLFGACELFVYMLGLYGHVAKQRQLSVTEPHIPDAGRRLFAGRDAYPFLRCQTVEFGESVERVVRAKRERAREEQPEVSASQLVPECIVRANLSVALSQTYQGLAMDFDGTVAPLGSEKDEPSANVCEQIRRLAGRGTEIAIVTGRGKSVIRALRHALPENIWAQITTFPYNGAIRWPLKSDTPNVLCVADFESLLPSIAALPKHISETIANVEKSSFGVQLTLHLVLGTPTAIQDELLATLSKALARLGLQAASSGRSVDIFPAHISKAAALHFFRNRTALEHRSVRFIRIGDRGDRGGNDRELLKARGGFSVQHFDWTPEGCFPASAVFGLVGTGPELTYQLLDRIECLDDGAIRFRQS